MKSSLFPATLAVIALFSVVSPGARAELGGYISVGGEGAGSAPARAKLSSFSWIRDDGRRVNDQNAGSRNYDPGPPENGDGLLLVVKPVAIKMPALTEACATKKTLPSVVIEFPTWEKTLRENEQIYRRVKLGDVTVSDCAHAPGAVGEVFYLKFASIEKLANIDKSPTHPLRRDTP